MSARILVVEDEEALTTLLRYNLDAEGYDLLGLVVGSEGQLGIVTEATVRILRSAEGARPVLFGFDSSEAAGACVRASPCRPPARKQATAL